jgi:RNA polymerase sigma-70 factor (ECF subfamily)
MSSIARPTLTALYVAHRAKLCALATRVLGNETDAEDAVHEAFVELLARETPLTGEPLPYLRAVVRRACRDRLRNRSGMVPLETADARLRPRSDEDDREVSFLRNPQPNETSS